MTEKIGMSLQMPSYIIQGSPKIQEMCVCVCVCTFPPISIFLPIYLSTIERLILRKQL